MPSLHLGHLFRLDGQGIHQRPQEFQLIIFIQLEIFIHDSVIGSISHWKKVKGTGAQMCNTDIVKLMLEIGSARGQDEGQGRECDDTGTDTNSSPEQRVAQRKKA